MPITLNETKRNPKTGRLERTGRKLRPVYSPREGGGFEITEVEESSKTPSGSFDMGKGGLAKAQADAAQAEAIKNPVSPEAQQLRTAQTTVRQLNESAIRSGSTVRYSLVEQGGRIQIVRREVEPVSRSVAQNVSSVQQVPGLQTQVVYEQPEREEFTAVASSRYGTVYSGSKSGLFYDVASSKEGGIVLLGLPEEQVKLSNRLLPLPPNLTYQDRKNPIVKGELFIRKKIIQGGEFLEEKGTKVSQTPGGVGLSNKLQGGALRILGRNLQNAAYDPDKYAEVNVVKPFVAGLVTGGLAAGVLKYGAAAARYLGVSAPLVARGVGLSKGALVATGTASAGYTVVTRSPEEQRPDIVFAAIGTAKGFTAFDRPVAPGARAPVSNEPPRGLGPRPSRFTVPAVEAVRNAYNPKIIDAKIIEPAPARGSGLRFDKRGSLRGNPRRVTSKAELRKRSTGRASTPGKFEAFSKDNPTSKPNVQFEKILSKRYEAVRIIQQTNQGVVRTEVLKGPKTGAGRDIAAREFNYNLKAREATARIGVAIKVPPGVASTVKNPYARPPSQVKTATSPFSNQAAILVAEQKTGFGNLKRVPQKTGPKPLEDFIRPRIEVPGNAVLLQKPAAASVPKGNIQLPGVRQRTGREGVFESIRGRLLTQKAKRTQLVVYQPNQLVPSRDIALSRSLKTSSSEFPSVTDLVSSQPPKSLARAVPASSVAEGFQFKPAVGARSGVRQEIKPIFLFAQDEKQKEIFKPGVILRSKPATESGPASRLIDAVALEFKPAQKQGSRQVQDVVPKFKSPIASAAPERPAAEVPVTFPAIPFEVPIVPGRAFGGRNRPLIERPLTDEPAPTFRLPGGSKGRGQPLFEVKVGKKGNKYFFDLGTGGADLIEKARGLGTGTAAASITVRQIGGRPIDVQSVLGPQFRRNKQGAFVQTTKYRISSAGEKAQIPGAARTKRLSKGSIYGKALKLNKGGVPLRSIRWRLF